MNHDAFIVNDRPKKIKIFQIKQWTYLLELYLFTSTQDN